MPTDKGPGASSRRGPYCMNLKPKAIKDLQEIVQRDYGVALSDDDANSFGASLLRITRITNLAFARAGEKVSSVQARERNSLEQVSV